MGKGIEGKRKVAIMTLEEAIELNNKFQRKRHSDNEYRIQCACIKWFRYQYPDEVIFAIPNGGSRNKIEASRLKAEGVLAGVPDVLISAARKGYHALYVEIKNGKIGKLSERQKEMIKKLQSKDYKAVVCRSVEEFVKEVEEYFN
jgi:hypothetical protein